jgi:hypothetical protein
MRRYILLPIDRSNDEARRLLKEYNLTPLKIMILNDNGRRCKVYMLKWDQVTSNQSYRLAHRINQDYVIHLNADKKCFLFYPERVDRWNIGALKEVSRYVSKRFSMNLYDINMKKHYIFI